MQTLEQQINQKFYAIFQKLNFDTKFSNVKASDRPDLSDFQCNGALALAKTEHKNPREVASLIVEELKNDSTFSKISIDGPGFINISISDNYLSDIVNEIANDTRLGVQKTDNPHCIVMDYGGPNVAKAMHVGHLRSGVIGEAIKKIEKFIGNKVIADVHFGDWGTPMGMIISEIINKDGDLSKVETYNVEEITEFYKAANIRCKEDENAKALASKVTAELQSGNADYHKAWQHLRKESVKDVKKNYEALGVDFDLWLGESDAHQTCGEIVNIAKKQNIANLDEGALILRLKESNKPKPPVILVKSDGGFGYQLTDIATIKMRVDDLQAQEIIYITDARQALHFEQVFEASEMLEICKNVTLKHIEFGTVNGADGKPFKTRDGGVMNLRDLIEISKDKVRESMPSPDATYSAEYIEKLVNQIAIAAIKFQDLKNNIASGYIFNLEDFAKFDGKTGPYIQYAIARINSILRKAKEKSLDCGKITISNEEERNLILKMLQLNNVIMRAHTEKEPSIISEYVYSVAQLFSIFYNVSQILNEPDINLASSRLSIAKLCRDIMTLLLDLLGIEAPEIMLKA